MTRRRFTDYPSALYEQQEYGASRGVGENPLNGKGMPLGFKGEEIVGSHVKA